MTPHYQKQFSFAPGVRSEVGPPSPDGSRRIMSIYFGAEGAMGMNLPDGMRPITATSLPRERPGLEQAILKKEVKAIRRAYAADISALAKDYKAAIDAGLHQQKRIPAKNLSPDWAILQALVVDPLERPNEKILIRNAFVGATLLAGAIVSSYAIAFSTALFAIVALSGIRALKNRKLSKRAIEEEMLYQEAKGGDERAIEKIFGAALSKMDWFATTLGSFEAQDNGRSLALEFSYPDLDKLPDYEVSYNQSAQTLDSKKKKNAELRKDFAIGLHSILLRIAGTGFVLFPTLEKISCSVFVQKTGRDTEDDLEQTLVRVTFDRAGFEALEPEIIDPIEVVGRFGPERDMDDGYALGVLEQCVAR